MKCLSLIQPYAELVATGKKTIELRKWKTKFRGTFLIHASRRVLIDDCKRLGFNPESLVTGAIVGKAELYGIKEYELGSKEWIDDKDKHFANTDFIQSVNGFLLRNAVKFTKPLPFSGQLNFFEVNYDEINHTVKPAQARRIF